MGPEVPAELAEPEVTAERAETVAWDMEAAEEEALSLPLETVAPEELGGQAEEADLLGRHHHFQEAEVYPFIAEDPAVLGGKVH